MSDQQSPGTKWRPRRTDACRSLIFQDRPQPAPARTSSDATAHRARYRSASSQSLPKQPTDEPSAYQAAPAQRSGRVRESVQRERDNNPAARRGVTPRTSWRTPPTPLRRRPDPLSGHQVSRKRTNRRNRSDTIPNFAGASPADIPPPTLTQVETRPVQDPPHNSEHAACIYAARRYTASRNTTSGPYHSPVSCSRTRRCAGF